MASKTEQGGDVPEDAIPPTVGEQAVRRAEILTRTLAAPSTLVADIEAKTVELIDIAEGLKQNSPRYAALAQTAYEQAGIWAVKAATS